MPEKRKEVGRKALENLRKVASAASANSFRKWAAVQKKMISEVRQSEKLTRDDLAVRINARG